MRDTNTHDTPLRQGARARHGARVRQGPMRRRPPHGADEQAEAPTPSKGPLTGPAEAGGAGMAVSHTLTRKTLTPENTIGDIIIKNERNVATWPLRPSRK